MKELPKYYTVLFYAVTQAIESIEAQNYGDAKRILIRGQCEAEGFYIAESKMEERKKEAAKAE